MNITYIEPDKQGLLLLYSLIVGYLTELLCSIIRLPSAVIKNVSASRKIFCIIIDILFDIITSIVHIIVIIIFIYAANSGIIRYFLLLAALFGVILYRISLGKLVNLLSDALTTITAITAKHVRKFIYPLKRLIVSRDVIHYIKTTILPAHRR